MNEKVSVIIPTYKRSEYLERAIESVLKQTYENIEIIVVDDNDPKSNYRIETARKMEKYRLNYKVKYIMNQKNLGGALARNEGIFQSTGDFVTFLDDDDIYLPEKVLLQVNFMLEKQFDLSFTDVRFHNNENVLVDYRDHHYVKENSNEELLKLHIMHHLTPTATYMFKRVALLNIGGFDDVKMGQEFMLMLKAIQQDLRIGYSPGAYVIQYIHDGERISIGENKIIKEVELFNLKKEYFSYFTPREQRYVKFRHHAVMMIVGKRSNKRMIMFKHFILSLLASPIDCIAETLNHIKKIQKYRLQK
ncbi:glycosyltransferase family 2 protein [Rossellomorea sp. YZS02]|uniref:glycosyltransferase family 2 protein n=1 Tax=Rossellomorea sp. YZS02 TaxID=3097358 RepID=UPI002A0B4746|nr:glycosyltransferase family 2 protein [Rossellomorea sp. YZS02]MDX8344149.1 glycosyltransferase family 2 protein [Rossellomorea sp. YZS02]